MIWTIAHREIRDHILSLRFYLGFALCLVLMVVGALVGAEEQGQQRENLAPFLDPGQYAEAGTLAYPLILLLYAVGFFMAAYLRFARDEI